jgi:ADP-ribosylation factor 1/2
MGGLLSAIGRLMFLRRPVKIVMVGLDAAGKTTVLYKLKLKETVTTIPTIGFNVEEVEFRNLKLTMWDIGGQDKIRPLWSHYYSGTDAIIFVVDSADCERISDARYELEKLLSDDDLSRACLLVIANKQDLPGAMSASKLADELSLSSIRSRKWFIQPASAVSGEGLHDGLGWLADTLSSRS